MFKKDKPLHETPKAPERFEDAELKPPYDLEGSRPIQLPAAEEYVAPALREDEPRALEDDEPSFLIRARDVTAVAVVGYWIDMARSIGVSPDKIRRAQAHLDEIKVWQANHPTKVPD